MLYHYTTVPGPTRVLGTCVGPMLTVPAAELEESAPVDEAMLAVLTAGLAVGPTLASRVCAVQGQSVVTLGDDPSVNVFLDIR